jgi:N-acetylneuraminic acid mutarotase
MRRSGPAVASLNGLVYVVGGSDGKNSLNTAERYDPNRNCWTPIAAMRFPRKGHGLASVESDCALYSVGGCSGSRVDLLNSVERYDALKDRWNNVSSLSCPRAALSCCTFRVSHPPVLLVLCFHAECSTTNYKPVKRRFVCLHFAHTYIHTQASSVHSGMIIGKFEKSPQKKGAAACNRQLTISREKVGTHNTTHYLCEQMVGKCVQCMH